MKTPELLEKFLKEKGSILSEHQVKLFKRQCLKLHYYNEVYIERAIAMTMLRFNARYNEFQLFSDEEINDYYYP